MKVTFPDHVKSNPGYWLSPWILWESRRKFSRLDNSTKWRSKLFDPALHPPDRSVRFSKVVPRTKQPDHLRIFVVGDSGEGDQSQWATVPLIRALDPDLMVINGDVAYPDGEPDAFQEGFFDPYSGLGIPIWAVPGNHEYYADQKGRTFYEIFCTRARRHEWTRAGLELVPQPGTYWELRDPGRDDASPLVILGLDTGMKGNLDGTGWTGWLHDEDKKQHAWLRQRLRIAEREGKSVIVLFHIPALVDGKRKKVGLEILHQILAESPAICLIVCGHIHNHQFYTPETWRSFLRDYGVTPHEDHEPSYIVSGGGGAFLSSPPKEGSGDYDRELTFPRLEDWTKRAGIIERLARNFRLARAAIGRVASLAAASARKDDDSGKYLSGVLIDVDGRGPDAGIEARQILMRDVNELFDPSIPGEVRADDPDPPLWDEAITELLKNPLRLR